jgi:hypothetical protein
MAAAMSSLARIDRSDVLVLDTLSTRCRQSFLVSPLSEHSSPEKGRPSCLAFNAEDSAKNLYSLREA